MKTFVIHALDMKEWKSKEFEASSSGNNT